VFEEARERVNRVFEEAFLGERDHRGLVPARLATTAMSSPAPPD